MPSLKMKAKLNVDCFRQKTGLHVCQKSSIISKHSSHIRISSQTAEFESYLQSCQDGKEQKFSTGRNLSALTKEFNID